MYTHSKPSPCLRINVILNCSSLNSTILYTLWPHELYHISLFFNKWNSCIKCFTLLWLLKGQLKQTLSIKWKVLTLYVHHIFHFWKHGFRDKLQLPLSLFFTFPFRSCITNDCIKSDSWYDKPYSINSGILWLLPTELYYDKIAVGGNTVLLFVIFN